MNYLEIMVSNRFMLIIGFLGLIFLFFAVALIIKKYKKKM